MNIINKCTSYFPIICNCFLWIKERFFVFFNYLYLIFFLKILFILLWHKKWYQAEERKKKMREYYFYEKKIASWCGHKANADVTIRLIRLWAGSILIRLHNIWFRLGTTFYNHKYVLVPLINSCTTLYSTLQINTYLKLLYNVVKPGPARPVQPVGPWPGT